MSEQLESQCGFVCLCCGFVLLLRTEAGAAALWSLRLVASDCVVVVGGWSKRCFSQSDERWLEGWSQRLKTSLERDFSA